MKTALLIATLVSTATLVQAAPNLVQNGGFEMNSYTSSSEIGAGYCGCASYGQGVADWTVTKFDVLWRYANATTVTAANEWNDPGNKIAPSFTALSDGGKSFIGLDADPTYGGPISQTINGLTVGDKYAVTFYWGATQLQNRSGPTTEQLHVSLGGETQDTTIESIGSQAFSGWMRQTFVFTANNTSDLLSFIGSGGPSGQPPFIVLDNVGMFASVPEPAGWALMLLGLGGIGALARSRRRAAALA